MFPAAMTGLFPAIFGMPLHTFGGEQSQRSCERGGQQSPVFSPKPILDAQNDVLHNTIVRHLSCAFFIQDDWLDSLMGRCMVSSSKDAPPEGATNR